MRSRARKKRPQYYLLFENAFLRGSTGPELDRMTKTEVSLSESQRKTIVHVGVDEKVTRSRPELQGQSGTTYAESKFVALILFPPSPKEGELRVPKTRFRSTSRSTIALCHKTVRQE